MRNKITAPKKTTIKGQPHQLAYINDAEQGLLMALGGSGEMVNGVPAYFDGLGDSRSQGGFGGQGRDYGGGGGNDRDDRGRDKAVEAAKAARDAAIDKAVADEIANRQAYQDKMGYGVSGGQATAMFGDATMSGMGFNSGDIDRILSNPNVNLTGILPELQARARRGAQISSLGGMLSPTRAAITGLLGKMGITAPKAPSPYENLATLISMPTSKIRGGGFFEPDAILSATTGGVGAFGTPANVAQGYFGNIAYTGMPDPTYEGPFQDLVRGDIDDGDGGPDDPEVVPANPVTGVCPEGYVFDDDLQACRLDTGSSASDTDGGGNFGDDSLTYYRPTILDTPSQFDPNPQAFTDMNNAFIDTFAYNPALYENKMDITGFAPTPTSGLLG